MVNWEKIYTLPEYAPLQPLIQQAALRIQQAQRIVITTHLSADGDAIGSQLALYWALQKFGKQCLLWNPSPVPPALQFLPGTDRIQVFSSEVAQQTPSPDLVIFADVSTPTRLAGIYEYVQQLRCPTILIDHHTNRSLEADLIISDPDASSTGELVWLLLLHLFQYRLEQVDRLIAEPLYAALMTDTGGFRFPRTDAIVHRIVAELIDHGADPAYVAEQIYNQMSIAKVRLLGEGLSAMTTYHHGQLCIMALPYQAFQQHQAQPEDTEGFVEYTLMVKGVRVGVLVVELPEMIKMSFRSKGTIPANKIAGAFGGGGHLNAAGARIKGWCLEDVIQKIIEVSAPYLAREPVAR